jgi:hypothetical protein
VAVEMPEFWPVVKRIRADGRLTKRATSRARRLAVFSILHQTPGSRLSDTPARCFSRPRTCKRRSRPPPVAVQLGFAE